MDGQDCWTREVLKSGTELSTGGHAVRGHTVLSLAGGAMAQLAVEGNVSAELVLDLSAVAAGLMLDVELVVVLVDAVRRALLPLVLALCGIAAVLLMLGGMVLLALLLSLLL